MKAASKKRLKLNKETMTRIAGGVWHRTTTRCHEGSLDTYCPTGCFASCDVCTGTCDACAETEASWCGCPASVYYGC